MFDYTCGDNIIRWDYYYKETICDKFSLEEWHKIVSDIDSEEDWQSFLSDYRDFVTCYILRQVGCKEPIGFVYLYKESTTNKILSIHGGGWGKSMHLSLLYFRGFVVFIENLLDKGIKVRTSCFVGNDRALRFLTSIGFVRYLTTENAYYMWINIKRLQNSKIYKYLKRENTKRDKPIKSVNKD